MFRYHFAVFFIFIFSFSFFSCRSEPFDPCEETVWFFDSDGDGYGGKETVLLSCTQPAYFVDNFDDFDDNDPNLNPDSVWSGPKITFTRANKVDWTLAQHQDRITNDVWIARAERQGIFNAKYESRVDYNSPKKTLWARGTTDDLGSLNFNYFRPTLYNDIGDEILHTDLVLYIPEEGILIDIKFTQWHSASDGGSGGFSYERSTPKP